MLTGIPLLALIISSILLIIVLIARWNVHPFLSLILASLYIGVCVGMPLANIIDTMLQGFGGLIGSIGLIVIFGSIIGVALQRSGGAQAIAASITRSTGSNYVSRGMSAIGALVSIPVFCDSGFILLHGITKKLSQITTKSRASLNLALATGLFTSHTLIPPTPGPIAVAGNIGGENYIGTILLVGLMISIPVLIISSILSDRLGLNILTERQEEFNDDSSITNTSVTKALAPILVPVLLITSGTITKSLGLHVSWLQFLATPTVAVLIGALLALWLLRTDQSSNAQITEAVKMSGPILIITGAGGAFGAVLKATPLKELVATWVQSDQSSLVVIIILFAIAALLKSAQGSSTSAMIIASSLLAPIIPSLGWTSPMEYALAVMAIGGGAMTVSHVNDSYFWVVSQFSGIGSKDMLRSFTLISATQGIVVLMMTLLLWIIMV